MKKSGRGSSYHKALLLNLKKSFLTHKKIKTTRVRAKRLAEHVSKVKDINLQMKQAGFRRGDNAPMVEVTLTESVKK